MADRSGAPGGPAGRTYRLLICINDRYAAWSTICDAPLTAFVSRTRMHAALVAVGDSHAEAEERLARCDRQGSSSRNGTTARDLAAFNRAGPGESRVPFDDLPRVFSEEAVLRGT